MEGGVDYAAACCHALCSPVLWIITKYTRCSKAVTFHNVFFAACSCFKHFIYIYHCGEKIAKLILCHFELIFAS